MVNDKRPESLSHFRGLHEVIYQVLRDGDSDKIATALGRTPNTVDHWGLDPELHSRPIPASMIVPFCIAAKDYRPLQWMAERVDAVLVRIPDLAAGRSRTSRQMAELAREFSDVADKYANAIEDDKITAREKEKLGAELDEMIAAAVRFRKGLSQ